MKFIQRLPHPPTLVLIKTLAASEKLPDAVHYIGEDGLRAIKGMQLVNRGRLSELSSSSPTVRLGGHAPHTWTNEEEQELGISVRE